MKKELSAIVKSRTFRVSLLCCFVLALLCMSAFALDDQESAASATVISAFQSGFQQIATDVSAILAVAVPIAVGIAAVLFITRKAMSWFKSMAK